ncbi:MAG TPA: hypothetical protein VNU93_06035, partial [Verrucomicrobiae bacterium]|nr:hypothetical protein [Verrucomicrobiae bacterium]
MGKRYFSPSLIIGFGPKAEGIISQMHMLMSHWESSKRNLVQTVLAKSPVGLWVSLQAAVDNLKDAERISKAEQEPGLFIRRDSGPMEINVFLLGEIGTVLNGLCLDNILRGVISLRFSWGAELGFTGANITTIGLVAGNQTPSRLVLHRMLEVYKSEEFLDSFGGRIFVVDNGLRDGSRISWQDLSLALARVIYLSISPGTEPLLLPQLGLIRKHERDTKLATLGITCFESPRDDSVLIQAAKYLEEMASPGTASPPQITPSGEALLDELEQLWVRDGFDSQRELSAKLRRGVEELLAGGSPIPAALAFIDLVHKRISTVQEQGTEISDPIEAQVEKRASLPVGHGKYPRLPLLLFGLFVPVAIYALASQSVSGSWLVWSITGIAGAALLSLGIMAMRKKIRKNPQEIVVERGPNMTGQEVLLLDTGGVEELRKECRRE